MCRCKDHKKSKNHQSRKHCDKCANLPKPPLDTIIGVELESQNCICCNDHKDEFIKAHDLNKYLTCLSYKKMCKDFTTPLVGYQGYDVNDPLLYVRADPSAVVPPGQKGIWPVPDSVPVDLTGKNVLVIGASRNIGRAIAERFVAEGCNVYGTSRHPECYKSTFQDGHLLKLDIRFSSDVKEFFECLMSKYFTNGQIDILVNCPGMQWLGEFALANGDDMADHYSFQVGGFQRVVFRALPFMRHSNSTRIISMGSVASELPILGHYSVVKRALQNWNDIHMQEALVRRARGSPFEPSFTLVEPPYFLSTIGLYENYKAACADPKNPNYRGESYVQKFLQNVNADPNLAFVADNIYNIAIAVQPSLRYLIDQTGFSAQIAQMGNLLSADEAMNFSQAFFGTLKGSEDTVQLFKTILADAYACQSSNSVQERSIEDVKVDLLTLLAEAKKITKNKVI